MINYEVQPKLGMRIIRWRLRRGVSRRQLAKAIGIAHQSLKQIEDGDTTSPRIQSLIQIATYFGKSVGELLGESSPDDTLFVKIPPNVHLTDIDKQRLRMRIDFELEMLQQSRAFSVGIGVNDEIVPRD